ncbi:hypothetical protein ACHAQH_002027 [Verticillium albo-atrum]
MAAPEMGDMAEVLARYHDKFPADFQDELKSLIESGDNYTLFTRLEDLIASRKLDDLLRSEDLLRRAISELYSARHPWLGESDLGASAWQREQERSLAALRERAARDKAAGVSHDMTQYERELGLARAHVAKFGIQLPEAGSGPEVPLAPSMGGRAPRQPFTAEWTFRKAPAGREISFDPKSTCEQFFPQPPVVAKLEDSDDEDDEEEEQGGDVEMKDVDQEKKDKETDADNVISAMVARLGVQGTMTFTTTETAPATQVTSTPAGTINIGGLTIEVTPEMTDWGPKTLKKYLEGVLRKKSMTPQVITLGNVRKLIWENEVFRRNSGAKTSQEKYFDVYSTQGLETESPTQPPVVDIEVEPPTPVEGEGVDETEVERQPGTLQPPGQTPQTGNIGTARPKTSQTRETAQTTPATIQTPLRAGGGDFYDENWLKNWLIDNNAATPDDLKMVSYCGWRIHSPKIMLIRIKNFLADEDLDRTLHWKSQFGEILIYLRHLRDNVYTGQDWGYDLNEVICMVKTHWVYEQHHYGEPELILNFKPGEHPKRLELPPNASSIIIADKEKQFEPVKPRYLQHRVPESVHDVDFQIPAPLLRSRFLTWFREDLTRLWHFDDPAKPLIAGIGSGARGDSMYQYGYNPDFNSAEVADNRFVKCMSLGTAETARTLREESNFYLAHQDFVVGKDGTLWPDGHAVRRFADFRGAKRAALQQCIEHFGTIDDGNAGADANTTHFRKLVLPTPWRERERIKADAQKIVAFPPLSLKEPPAGEKIDPFGYVYWHDQMLRNHEERARNAIPRTQRDHAERFDPEKVAVLPSWNFMGPFKPTFVPRHVDIEYAKAKRFRNMITKVELANRRAPRKLLRDILENFRRGTALEKPAPDVWDELERQSKELPQGESYRAISPDDHHWMEFIAGPSTNDQMLKKKDLKYWNWYFKLFCERLQMLLDDPWKGALFAKAGQYKTVAKIRAAINSFAASNTLKESLYTDDDTRFYCEYLATRGRLSRMPAHDEETILYGRPKLTHHPELRISFYVPPLHLNPLIPSRPEQELPAPHGPLLDWKAAIVANLPLIASSIDQPGPSREDRVSLAYRTLAYRLGRWTEALEKHVEMAYAELEAQGADQGFSLPVDRYRVQIDDLHGVWRQEVESQHQEPGAAVSYASVARAAEPGVKRDWEAWGKETWHPEAIEAVRTGLIRELSEGGNMLWPVRPRWEGEEGKETMTLTRENIWDFGREGVRGGNLVKKQFFSVNKWPLHLQSEATQRKIRDSGPKPLPPKADAGGTTEKTTKETDPAQESKPATDPKGAKPVTQTEAKGKEAEVDKPKERDLGPRLHEVAEPKYQFYPGITEYRKGDTPRQKAAIEQAVLDEMRDALGGPPSESAPRARTWWGGWGAPIQEKPAEPAKDPSAPMFEFPKLKPHQIPRSVPKLPPGQAMPRRRPRRPVVDYYEEVPEDPDSTSS